MVVLDKLRTFKMIKLNIDKSLVRSFQTSPQLFDLDEKPTLRERFESKRSEAQNKMLETQNDLRFKRTEAKTRVKMGFLGRFLEYLGSYGTILEKAFPDTVVKTYRLFTMGTSALMRDIKVYIRVQQILTLNAFDRDAAYRFISFILDNETMESMK